MDQPVGRSEKFYVTGVAMDIRGEADRGEDLVDGVADVFEFVVELVSVVLEPVLEAFQ